MAAMPSVPTTNTALSVNVARKPLTIGLRASPVSEAVVSSPKPAPRARRGIADPAVVYAAVSTMPTTTPKTPTAATA